MPLNLQFLVRRLLPALLAALASWATAAAPVYRAHVIAPPVVVGDLEWLWYTALDANNAGTSLLMVNQYGNPDVGFVTFDKSGWQLRHVGGYSGRYGGSLHHAINNTGDVAGHWLDGYHWVGEVQQDQGFGAQIRGFPEGTFGGWFSSAYVYGLSDAGHAVGQAEGELDGRWRGFVWQGGAMREVGSLGGPTSTAVAVNDKGQAVGHADLADGRVHAFSFRAGVLTDLGTLGGGSSWAVDVNQRGQVVGSAQQADGSERAFLYATGQMNALPTPEGASAYAASINRHGQVVGGYRLAKTGHPFLFDGGLVHRLQDLLDPADQTRWTIVRAVSINDKGWILVDAKRRGDQHTTVLLLKPRR
jgi:probable HAF family extracellular repeat protein